TRLGKPFAGIEQGFAGDTADVETGAAEGWRLLHTGYSQAELRGANRPYIAARTCADHQNIEALCLSHSSIRNEMSLESGVRSPESGMVSITDVEFLSFRTPHSAFLLHSQQQAIGILETLLDPPQEQHRLTPIDDAVVVGEGHVHHRSHDHLVVGTDHRSFLNFVHTENTALRRVQDWRG